MEKKKKTQHVHFNNNKKNIESETCLSPGFNLYTYILKQTLFVVVVFRCAYPFIGGTIW